LHEEGSWINAITVAKNYYILKNTTSFTVFFTSFIYLIFSIIFKEGLFSYKRKLFIILIFILIFLQSPFTLSHLGGPHLFILYPFIQIIEAIGIVELIELFKKSKTMLAIMSCILLIFIFEEINATFRNNYLYFLKTGGSGNNSDAIYSLTKWLKENKYYAPVTLDWGMYHNIIFISKGEIVPTTFDYIIKQDKKRYKFIKECKKMLKYKDNTIYISHSQEFSNFPEVYGIFIYLVKKLNKNVKEIKKFYQRDGKEVFVVYSTNVNK
jgi:rubrerythrin